MDRILSGAGTGSGSSEGEDSGDESHDQQGDVAMETPCSEEEDQREQQGGGNRLQSAISQLRSGQASRQRQSPDSTHSIPQPPPPYQSPPLQSLDHDFSQQQPGPSGLHLIASPPNQSQGPLHFPPSATNNAGEGQLVPDGGGRTGGNDGRISSGPLFQIPPSQDVLAQTSTQDISTGFSQSVDSSSQSLSAGPPMMSLPVGFDHLPEAQRELEEEERWQREQEEREERELRQQQAQELSEWMNRPSVPPQPPPPPEAPIVGPPEESDPLEANTAEELNLRAARRLERHRQRAYRVPGTESSQSSDEGFAASYNRAITRAIHKTESGVPHIPSQLITSGHLAKNQAMTTTASESESSSGEPQALKEDVSKVDDLFYVPVGKAGNVAKRPPQKVPRLSSRKLAQIKPAGGKTLPTGSVVVSTTSGLVPAQTPPPAGSNSTGAPSSSSSFVSPSTTAFSADSERSTESSAETEETASEMEAQPTEPSLEPPSAASVGEHQVDLEEEQQQQQLEHLHRSDSGIPPGEQESYIGGEADEHARRQRQHQRTANAPRSSQSSQPSPSRSLTVGVVTSPSSSSEEGTRRVSSITAKPPASWGCETDVSTDLPATQTTSSSGTGSSSGSASANATLSSTNDSSQTVQSGSQYNFDVGTQSQTLPVTSTPESGSYPTHSPGVEMSQLVRKPLKRTSNETTSSSTTTTTSSSSAGTLEKLKMSKRTSRQEMDTITPVREDPTNQSTNPQEENIPFALESPTPPETPPSQQRQTGQTEVVPLTPPEGEQAPLPDISPSELRATGVGIASSSAGSTIASRTRSRKYIRKEDSQDLGNQLPSWVSEVLPSLEEGDESQTPTQSGSKRSHDTSSSSDQSSQSPRPPPPKRKRARSSRSSSSDGNVPKWAKETNMTDTNIGASEQAQPTNIPSAERVKSSSSGDSGQAPTDLNKSSSPNKSISFSQTTSSSQSGTLSGTSGTSSSSSGRNTLSSSGTTSSSGGYPPSSSHSSGSPEDHPPDNDKHSGSPRSDDNDGGRGDSSQPRSSGSGENSGQSSDKKDSSVGEANMETNTFERDISTAQEKPSEDQTSQTEGTQDSFLRRKDNSSSLSSREGGESGYIGGSSSVSVLASISPSKSTSSSMSAPLATVSDSQETLESSVSCIEDSVPLTSAAFSQSNLLILKTPGVPKSAQKVDKNEESDSNKPDISDDSPHRGKEGEEALVTSESQDDAAEVSSELLPLEPPHSPEILNDGDGKQDDADSPVIAIQGAGLPRDRDSMDTSPVIALQSPLRSKKDISKATELAPMEVEEPESSQAMETDMISTQNSFILQLADSQSMLTPFSPLKQSQHKPVDSERLSKEDGSSTLNPHHIEQDKNDIPELKQANKVVGTNNKQIVSSIDGKQNDASLEASKHSSATISAVSLLGIESISEKDQHSAVKSKPIPLYESLLCEDSSSQASINFVAKETSASISSNQRLSELQDTSQITNSGTPFNIHLPQSSLHPQFSMTPPSQRPALPNTAKPAQQMVSAQPQKAAQSGSNSSASSDVPMVSPSELDTSVFKSPTPTEMSENQNQKSPTNTEKAHLTRPDNSSSVSRNAESKSLGEAETNADNVMATAADPDQTVTSEHPMEVSMTEVSVDKVTTDREGASHAQVGYNSPVTSTLTKQASRTGNSSPRMSLSLKKAKVASSSVKRLLNMNTTEDTNTQEAADQFVLGVGANEGDLDSSVESQFHLPVVQVPNDSQFELSGDSQNLLQIQNPVPSETVGQPPVSSSQKQLEKKGSPSATPFGFVNPAQSSRLAIKKAKESHQLQTDTSAPHTREVVSNQGRGSDPYEYDSQNVDSEVDFIMQRKAKRAASDPKSKALNIAPGNNSVSQNPGEQGDTEGEKVPENVPSFSSEPPSLSTTDIRRPVIHHQPASSHSQQHNEGSQTITSRPIDQVPQLGSQPAADIANEAPSGSQPLANTAASRPLSPFLSPSLILPSTSSAGPLPSISPSAAVPSSLVNELKKRAGLDGEGDYQLKLVKVVRTIVEERHVFAEDVQQGHVVQNSGRSWIEHSPPSTQAIEQVCLSPAVTSSNQSSSVSFTFTLSSSNFYQPNLGSSTPSIQVIPSPLITQRTIQPSSTVQFPAIAHSASHSLAPCTASSTPFVQPVGADAVATHSRTDTMDFKGDQGTVTPVVGDLPHNSHQHDDQGETSKSSAPPPAAVSRDTTQGEVHNSQSQNANNGTAHIDGDDVAPDNQLLLDSNSILEDTCGGDPGDFDDNDGSDSDSVIVIQESTPATRRNQSSQPTQLDSSEDFQESPLPKTPKRTAAKKSIPQSHANKPSPRVAAGKRGLSSTVSKDTPHVTAPPAKKVIVTRSMTSSRSYVGSGASTRPPREFYKRTIATPVQSSKPPQPSTARLGHGQVTTKPTTATKRATSGTTTSTQAAKTSSASTVKTTPTVNTNPAKPTVASESTAAHTVKTPSAAKHAISARPLTPTTTKSTRNTLTKSTPNSTKPSRPTSSARPATSTRSSKPPSKAAIKENSATRNSKRSTVSGIASSSQSRNSSKSQQKGTKRRLADEAPAEAASPRKKARSFEPGSPRGDGVNSEIALHTRAHDHLTLSPEASTSSVSVGSMVMARWGDRNWYPANVLDEGKNGKYSIMYADGDTGVVPRSNMFPMDYLELDIPVMIMANRQSSQSKSSGLFAGFNKDSAQQFFVEDSSHVKHTYDLTRLCLPQESVDICLIKHTGQPYSEPSRKRGRSSMLASPRDRDTTGPAVKKKKTSCSPSQSQTGEYEDDVPSGQKSLFHGYTFMLTQKPKEDGRSATPPIVPINRDAIAQQLMNRRGKVVDNYDEDTMVFRGRFFVLSDTCCRTHKYLIGLALGVPCVRYSWIRDCIEEGRVLDHSGYVLPAGHDQSNAVPWSPRDSTCIMEGITVHVFSTDEKFKDHWNAILRAANAKTCSRLPSSNQIARSKSAAELCGTVVVSELRYVTKSLVHQVSNTGMKLVNTEWIVQSLIHGKARTDYKRFSLN